EDVANEMMRDPVMPPSGSRSPRALQTVTRRMRNRCASCLRSEGGTWRRALELAGTGRRPPEDRMPPCNHSAVYARSLVPGCQDPASPQTPHRLKIHGYRRRAVMSRSADTRTASGAIDESSMKWWFCASPLARPTTSLLRDRTVADLPSHHSRAFSCPGASLI